VLALRSWRTVTCTKGQTVNHHIHIKHCARLIGDIADGLATRERYRLSDLKVIFHVGELRYDFSVRGALDTLAGDLYFDERGDWSEADSATVEVL